MTVLDDKTKRLLESQDPEGNLGLEKDLIKGIDYKLMSKGFEAQAEEYKERADEKLFTVLGIVDYAMGEAGMKTLKLAVGTVGVTLKKNVKVDQARVKELLLDAGVSIEVITRVWKAATTISTSEYINFRKARSKL